MSATLETLTLRDVRAPDLDAVAELERISFPIPWKREFFASEVGAASASTGSSAPPTVSSPATSSAPSREARSTSTRSPSTRRGAGRGSPGC